MTQSPPSTTNKWPSRIVHSSIVDYALLFLLPLFLLWCNDTWIFQKPIGIDRWVYAGFHVHLHALLTRFSYTYYAARAPWNLFGWTVHRALPLEPALYVIHLSVFYLALFSLYSAVLALFRDRLAALCAALVLAIQASFLVGVGSDYVDGAFTACLLLSLAALAKATVSSRWRVAAFVWGFAITLFTSIYLLLSILIPIEIAAFLILNQRANRHSVFAVAMFVLFGAVGTVLTIGALNALAGGPLLYFTSQISAVPRIAAIQGNWYDSPSVWVKAAPWLFIPSTAVLVSVMILARKFEAYLKIAAATCISATALFFGLHIWRFPVLEYGTTTNALLPFDFLVIGGTIAQGTSRLSTRERATCRAWIISLACLPWLLSRWGLVEPNASIFTGINTELVVVAGCSVALIVAAIPRPVVLVAVLAVYSTVSFLTENARFMPDDAESMRFPADPYYREATLAVFQATSALEPYDRGAEVRFWFNAHDPSADIEGDVNSMYLFDYSQVNEDFPSLVSTKGISTTLVPNDRVVILVSRGNPIPAANASVAGQNLIFKHIRTLLIHRPGVEFEMVVADVLLDEAKYETLRLKQGPVLIQTPRQAWAYAYSFPLPAFAQHHRNAAFRIAMTSVKGQMWVGVLNRDGTSFLDRRMIQPGPRSEVTLTGIDTADASSIIIENGAAMGASTGTLQSIEALEPKRPAKPTSRHTG